MIFFTSDHHFWHKNVLLYCPNRNYSSVYHMNDDYKFKWNKTVKKEDTVYYVGDFAFHHPNRIKELLDSLNGTKILIRGNHDRTQILGFFAEVHTQLHFEEFLLSHKPNYTYKKPHLCGHVHQKWKFNDNRNILNVGVDIWDGWPVSIDQVREEFTKINQEIHNE